MMYRREVIQVCALTSYLLLLYVIQKKVLHPAHLEIKPKTPRTSLMSFFFLKADVYELN